MKIFYHPNYNIDFGWLNRIHPFDGMKYAKVYAAIKDLPGIQIEDVPQPISLEEAQEFANDLLKRFYVNKRYILNALSLPYIPLLPFSYIDRKILLPMRWAVAGTIMAAKHALAGGNAWNLSGGYHHATRAACEGFCIYNDIGIAVRQLRQQALLAPEDRILIIDVDAHHGNGNAALFKDDRKVTLLDIYNRDIYPQGIPADISKERVNIALPVPIGTSGAQYLQRLEQGLALIQPGYAICFVVAGTDVLQSDPLGGLCLSIAECVQRDSMVLARLRALAIPAVVLAGGGYSAQSATQIAASIAQNYQQ